MKDSDVCQECYHTRKEHGNTPGCMHTEKDRLGFVREICECERFVEDESRVRRPTE